jgi:hypothetical protein
MKLNFFLFNGKFYEQTEGTAMGNALLPFLANLYTANFVMVLKRRNLLPKVWVRYVDDIFYVINRRKVSTLLSLLNSQNPSIKFTCEEEVDGSLPFLDVRVTRRDSRLEFKVYRKPTNTQRCIPIAHRPKWCSGYDDRLLTQRFRVRIPGKVWFFRWFEFF